MTLESIWIIPTIVFVIAVLALLIKIILMKKAAREIREKLSEKLNSDTNTLIDISSSDKDMRALAADLNTQLVILRRKQLRFTQGDTELKNAVTNISHDLRTPLTAICGYLDIIKKEEKSEKLAGYLDIIEDRAALMKQLTEELFRYSVIISESEEYHTEEVTVNSVLEDSVMGYYAALCERGIEPSVRITEKPIVRKLNRADLARVFANLIGNALKYSDCDLSISLDDDGVISFSNTASSLDGVEVGRLFERFYTLESARNSTGLGLSIARTLVERMGGTIAAEYSMNVLCIKIDFKNE
ncbi:MAG: HAMP domain-containing histidine kinase [Oscillospiraceae bacterium]|nr:HAMP domain-containing histidine kinase [Oscillospiraceae bacterium]